MILLHSLSTTQLISTGYANHLYPADREREEARVRQQKLDEASSILINYPYPSDHGPLHETNAWLSMRAI